MHVRDMVLNPLKFVDHLLTAEACHAILALHVLSGICWDCHMQVGTGHPLTQHIAVHILLPRHNALDIPLPST